MRDRRSRRSGGAGNARPDAAANAAGNGGLLSRFRKLVFGSVIGAAFVASLVALVRGYIDPMLTYIVPSAADTVCALRETVTNSLPFGEKPASDRFTILIAKVENDDAEGTYAWAITRAFLNQERIDWIRTCRVLRLDDFGGASGQELKARTVATAQRWLTQKRADLLIGGRKLEKDKALDLWFIGEGGGKGFEPKKFSLDANLLKEDFAKEASDQLLAVALSAVNPATEQQGRYLVEILRPVIARLRNLLQDVAGLSREQRAQLQHALGLGLWAVGEQSGRNQDLVDAATAFRAALAEWTRERVPLDWAVTQNNLGNALVRLGERESGTARLEEAVAAYRQALTEWTRERVPLNWAVTQNNLGSALETLGERESGTARLEEAVAAFHAALTARARERVPLQWATTQNNLGAALWSLGEREGGTARLEEAVAAFRAALAEGTRERVPLQWAATQNNLGAALSSLGERESGTARLEEAVAAYRQALTERTRERVPYDWAQTQENVASAFRILATRTAGEARLAYLREALAAVDDALQVYRAGKAAYDIGTAERLRARILAETQQAQAAPR